MRTVKSKIDEMSIKQYEKLVKRVVSFVKEQNLGGGHYPTFLEISRRYKINFGDIQTIIEDSDLLMENVGVCGNGAYGTFDHKGEHNLEYMGPIED